jgi:glutathione S-transferase
MKLYYSPGACSLASHIALREAGAAFDLEKADLRAKTTETGGDFRAINPRGAVPALVLDGGEVLTEGVAIMQYVADNAAAPTLPAQGTLARARLHEALNYVASEVHKSYSPFFRPMSDEARAAQVEVLDTRLAVIEGRLADGRAYLTGADYTPADGYLFTVTNWSGMIKHDLSAFPRIEALRARVAARPAVQAAMQAEGLV